MNKLKKSFICLLTSSCLSQAYASGLQIWDQNAAGVGDYHAGYAVDAADASTSFYNPAGLTYLDKMQVVGGIVAAPTNIVYNGKVNVSTVNPVTPQFISNAQAGTFNAIPDLYFAQPLSARLTWGLGLSAPFGCNTGYNTATYMRYASTKTTIQTIDMGPSLGFKLRNNLSVGGGVDAIYGDAVFDQYAGFADTTGLDTLSDNRLNGWGYGYHLGALYQPTLHTRLGLSYHSKVDQHLTGRSRFIGDLANSGAFTGDLTPSTQISNNLKSNLTLPPYTTLSGLQNITDQWSILASATYTQWRYIKTLELENIAVADSSSGAAVNNAVAYITQNFHNTWNLALGTEYQVNQKIKVRSGAGYDQTPIPGSTYRYPQTPDQNRIAVAVGGQYKITKKAIMDLGWTHLFMANAAVQSSETVGVNPNNPNPNGQTVTADGTISSSADLFGMQFTWQFD